MQRPQLWPALGVGRQSHIGLVLKAWALFGGPFVTAHWLHAFTLGPIATTIVAVMTRTSLGHTGRELNLDPLTIAAYGLLAAATIVRVLAPAWPGANYLVVVAISAALWAGAFAAFLWVYAPILMGRRSRRSGPGRRSSLRTFWIVRRKPSRYRGYWGTGCTRTPR